MELNELTISSVASVKKAMEKMDQNAKKIIYVEDNNRLIGSLSDGDIRRYILKDASIQEAVTNAMNATPFSIKKSQLSEAQLKMKELKINSIPVLNDDLTIDYIIFSDNQFTHKKSISNQVVIMAGGKGSRLYPYTKILPKPLIPIGDTPIMERIIDKFADVGCRDFLISVNYRKNMIKSYFEDEPRAYDLNFIEESVPLGTGGSLSLMKEFITDTFFVSNCDILVDADYTEIIDFHKSQEYDITFVASLKNTQIPYGVLKLSEEGLFESTVEKPEYSHLINTGMYVFEPKFLELVPNNEFADLPDIIMAAKSQGYKIGVFPVSENAWLDMGQFTEMENMMEKLGVK
ncbi:nucleotidyltransferase family protein [uncultured Vagococcus sp.]|uniref:nucleotidyltransferase family protein n=1 Tax=uncultured Vagococcus sp. TaxID=189676 RepID=UPI0028D1E905|nr:nucleotidyltransferase family protein [uncultured Vagococcus sp.]